MAVRRHLAEAWSEFEAMVVPAIAGPTQRDEMRKAFFSGAAVFFELMTNGVSDGDPDDVTDEDMSFMSELNDEIEEFKAEVVIRAAATRGRGIPRG